MPAANDIIAADPIVRAMADRTYTGTSGDYLEIPHRKALALSDATLSLSFSLDRLVGEYALVSKDGNGRGAGDFTVWLKDGTIVITQEGASESEWLKVPDLVLEANTTYAFALSFGAQGLQVWLNGDLVAAEPAFKQGMLTNTHPLVIGGSRAWHNSDTDPAHSLFKGTVGDVMVFDGQLGEADVIALAGATDPELAHHAETHDALDSLMPVLGQLHHASDTFMKIMMDYGADMHGHFETPLTMTSMVGRRGNELAGTARADGLDGGRGDDVVNGRGGNDVLQGGYGNDRVIGGAGRDILDGGHGEDRLFGGGGDDLLISRADGREGAIFYDPNRDEGDPLNELTNGKLYPDQPIPADDVLSGGKGADIFYFQTLINAKQRYIEKHTNDDGTINWHGVAGENDKLHDHWVDVLGNDVITDYSRSEGDRIVIEGHTTQIASITYGDRNGDGVLDHSVIALYSDQGNNGGAHNDDRLGTITVYGDLVKRSDIEHTAAPAYGIITSIEDLGEAIKPTDMGVEAGGSSVPRTLPTAADLDLPINLTPVAALPGTHVLSGEDGDYLNVGHAKSLALSAATIALSFSLDRLPGDYALVSKDGNGRGAGDFTVWLKDGTIVITQEGASESEWLKVPDLVLEANTTYAFALSFGAQGLQVWLNGDLVAAEPAFKQGMLTNTHPLVIGGSRAWHNSDTDPAHSLFKGTVGDVMVFDGQLGEADVIALAGATDPELAHHAETHDALDSLMPVLGQLHHASDTFMKIMMDYGADMHGHFETPLTMTSMVGRRGNELAGTARADGLDGGRGDDVVNGRGGNDVLQGGYGNDRVIGGAGRDILDGGHGEDRLFGGGGDDLLISRADGREGAIFYDPNRDEGDPLNELTNGKLYPDQPIPADDVLSGGKGADIFYFQTLINAKQRYIEKHTNDDGTINWHGVAGENDKLHDHWVDVLGNDVITDYSRSEGDRIVIEGHTTQIASITYGDRNGDGVLDHSVIALYSDQGNNGGAHNDDRLGTITVYGDLVKRSDIEHTAAPAYGIITSIKDLGEAVKPTDMGEDTGRIRPPKDIARPGDLGLPAGLTPVLAVAGSHDFSPDDRAPLVIDHEADLALAAGTIAFTFKAADTGEFQVLFSKDASGDSEGHIAAYVNEIGSLTVRIQSDGGSHYMTVDHAVKPGDTHQFALNFGPEGLELWLDGARVAYEKDITIDLTGNAESLVVGATGWGSTPGTSDMIYSHFEGTITDFMIFDRQLDGSEVFGTAPRDDTLYLDRVVGGYDFARASDGLVISTRGSADVTAGKDIDYLHFANLSVRVSEVQFGTRLNDGLTGRDGADVLLGYAGNDDLRGYDNDDVLRGGDGDDSLFGGNGEDMLEGDNGNDRLFGGNDADIIFGGSGDDEIYGEDGNDRIYGGLGDDRIYGHVWNSGGSARNDRVYYDGNRADYSFATARWFDSNRGGEVTQLTITDSADGGRDGYYEGKDRLIDIDFVVFADQTVAFSDLL